MSYFNQICYTCGAVSLEGAPSWLAPEQEMVSKYRVTLKRVEQFVKCRKCDLALFCSEACRTKGAREHQEYCWTPRVVLDPKVLCRTINASKVLHANDCGRGRLILAMESLGSEDQYTVLKFENLSSTPIDQLGPAVNRADSEFHYLAKWRFGLWNVRIQVQYDPNMPGAAKAGPTAAIDVATYIFTYQELKNDY